MVDIHEGTSRHSRLHLFQNILSISRSYFMTLLVLTIKSRDTFSVGFLLWILSDSLLQKYECHFVLMHFIIHRMHPIKNHIFIFLKKELTKEQRETLGMAKYEVLKVGGQKTSRTANSEHRGRLQSVLKGRGMPRWHAGSSVHRQPQTWHSQRRESTQKHRGVGIVLPTAAYSTYLALGYLLHL